MKISEIYAMCIKDVIALEKVDECMPALEFLFKEMSLAKYTESLKAKEEASDEEHI